MKMCPSKHIRFTKFNVDGVVNTVQILIEKLIFFHFKFIQIFFTDFQRNVLMKLDTIICNQEEHNNLLRQLASRSRVGAGEGQNVVEDVVPEQMDNKQELEEFCAKLQDTDFRKKMVIF